MLRSVFAVCAWVAFISVLRAGEKAPPLPTASFKEVKVFEGFDATLFAAPPDVSYPVALCAAPTGEVFVAVDLNGSLDRKPDRGWIVRCIDTDGDGKADKFNKFVEKVESPRGLFWDNGTLWVLHPPFLRKYEDKNGDGVADNPEGEVLVKGIGFGLDFRGADHTTNGIMMGIDGWIYIAVGDYGFIKAVDKNGKELQMLGGGIARVRPDGTELEIVSRGQRNIYDMAIDPFMNLFTRDNTNDGGGWEVRLSHVPQGAQMGYPSLFKGFSDEIVQPLAIYGGGSPCGSIYLDESSLPAPWNNMLYTVEWGRSAIMAHPLESNGASFKADQKTFVEVNRPTDMDIDGSGRMYISTWKNGGFNYGKPDVGYIVRVAAKGATHAAFPDLPKMTDEELIGTLAASGSHVLRLYTSREILRRGTKPTLVMGVEKIAASDVKLANRVAAIFTLKQLQGVKSNDALVKLAGDAKIREFALKALADRTSQNEGVPAKPFTDALKDADARVRVQAVTGLGRLGKAENGEAVVPLVADTDPIVAHLSVHALVEMKAIEACLNALDKGSTIVQPGVNRALQALHDPKVVDGVIARFQKADDPVQKKLLFKTLCRLHFTESPYEGKWWGTRPDTSGPYYFHKPWEQSEKIAAVLKGALNGTEPALLREMLLDLRKHKVDLPEAMPLMLKLANDDAAFRATAVELMLTRGSVPDEALPLLEGVALSDKEDGALRAKAFQGLQKNPKALDATVRTVVLVNKDPKPHGDLNKAKNDFLTDNKHLGNLKGWGKLAEDADAEKREVAYTILLNLENNKLTKPEQKKQIGEIVEAGWSKPGVASLIRAVGNTKSQEFAAKVQGLASDTRPGVADAVKYAGTKIKLDAKALATAQKPTLSGMKYEDIVAAVMKAKGDAKHGAEVFTKVACVTCHTTSPKDPVKGPYLGDIAGRYNRAELAESILKPNAKIAQGFTTHFFITKDKKRYDGFVTKEGAEEIEMRNVQGEAITIKTAEINKRGKIEEMSIMPEGLVDGLTVEELASLLTYLGTLTGHAGAEK